MLGNNKKKKLNSCIFNVQVVHILIVNEHRPAVQCCSQIYNVSFVLCFICTENIQFSINKCSGVRLLSFYSLYCMILIEMQVNNLPVYITKIINIPSTTCTRRGCQFNFTLWWNTSSTILWGPNRDVCLAPFLNPLSVYAEHVKRQFSVQQCLRHTSVFFVLRLKFLAVMTKHAHWDMPPSSRT